MSLQQDINLIDEVNNFQIKDSQRESKKSYRKKRKKIRVAKTDIYNRSSIIYKELFRNGKGYS